MIAHHSNNPHARPVLILLITEDWYFWSHRVPIAQAALAAGYRVIVATRVQEHGERIRALGCEVAPIRLRRKSRNPFTELAAIGDLVGLYRRERPTVVHHVTIKPVLYGSWAARIARVPAVVNAVAGLGHVFVASGLKSQILKKLVTAAYRSALSYPDSCVIFQNPHDLKVFVDNNIIKDKQARLIRGAGVDLQAFPYSEEQPADPPIVMLASRLLWDKGVGELVKAGQLLRARGLDCRIVIVGEPDLDNPNSIPEAILRAWHAEGSIEWWGRTEQMAGTLAQAHIVVLPTTYGEGVPKILLEGAAIGRPLIATEMSGCEQIVRHGDNGYLIPARKTQALADAIATLLVDPALRLHMGRRGRAIAEAEFSDKSIAQQTLAVYTSLIENNHRQ